MTTRRITTTRRLLVIAVFAVGTGGVTAQQLPIACGASNCGAGVTGWVTQGAAQASTQGARLDVTQSSDRATLNWSSFNIGAGGTVNFAQPDSGSVALNRIFQADPSKIFGSLTANGRVYLINTNGILFGDGARVDVGGLIASTLEPTPEALSLGLTLAATAGRPAFAGAKDAQGKLLNGAIEVAQGARLTADNGQIFLFAPDIVNRGELVAADGQIVLAAGERVYLTTSADPDLRGLFVEVDAGGTATNAVGGLISTPRGDVTIAGLAVNQFGRVSATTAVRQNGSIRLLARDTAQIVPGTPPLLRAHRGGTLEVGPGSTTEVSLETGSTEATVDTNVQPRSNIEMSGNKILVLENALVSAPAGRINLTAQRDPDPTVLPISYGLAPSDSRVYVADGAVLDASGASLELPMSRNIVNVEARANQVRDSPLQRDGALRGSTVQVDIRDYGTRADGTAWQGTPLVDGSGEISAVARTVAERSLNGGDITIQSAGDIVLAAGSRIDLDGGAIAYQGGYIQTTKLLGVDGRVYDIADASPDRFYVGPVTGFEVAHTKWGVTEVFPGFGTGTQSGHYEAGYIEGYDAGSLTLTSPRVVMDGGLTAAARRGEFQRRDATASPLRFDTVPLGGTLTLGYPRGTLAFPSSNYALIDVDFADRRVITGAFDPVAGVLPALDAVVVRPELLRSSAVSTFRIFSNGKVTLPAATTLAFGVGGELDVTAGQVDLLGRVVLPSGTIDVTSRATRATDVAVTGTHVGAASVLDTAGTWTNDNPLLGSALGPVALDGGSISLRAERGALDVDAGSLLNVSAGAWRRQINGVGDFLTGRGGSLSLVATSSSTTPVPINLGGTLLGFGFKHGGKLSLGVPSACIAVLDCADDEIGTLWLAPAWLTSGGFETLSVATDLGGLELLPGTQFPLQQRNLLFSRNTDVIPTGTPLATFVTSRLLPAYARSPVNLALKAHITPFGGVDAALFDTLPVLALSSGSRIDADTGASITLSSNTSVYLQGSIVAPGGTVSVAVDAGLNLISGLRDQGIWLDQGAAIDVSGTTVPTPNTLGLVLGDVIAGGKIAFKADRGYVYALPGSSMDLRGDAAELDIRSGSGLDSRYTRQLVGSDAGTLSVTAAEGALLSGEILAAGGDAPGTEGGLLSILLDPNNRGEDPVSGATQGFSLASRSISIGAESSRLVVGIGVGAPSQLEGRALLSANDLMRQGFDHVSLAVRNLFQTIVGIGVPELKSTGEILLDGDFALRGLVSLALDGSTVRSNGGTAAIDTVYLGIADRDRLTQDTGAAVAGSGVLRASADLIEVTGNVGLQGFESFSLLSSGDLRLNPIQMISAKTLTGSLTGTGRIELGGARVYPTTLADFTVRSIGAGGSIAIVGTGPSSGAPLSVGGHLRLQADAIVQGGNLLLPFGALTMVAKDITFAPGSRTSTSADGATLPFGTTQGGFDWAYPLADGRTLVFGNGGLDIPRQAMSLNATTIDFAAGAEIDVSGGGDYRAFEFVPGVGGSRDILSPLVSPTAFAVAPGMRDQFAPFDTLFYTDSKWTPTQSVYLEGVPGLPAGVYPVLPARYALLPGAFLVTPVAGYQDLAAGETRIQPDGSRIVSGAFATTGTDHRDSRSSGFLVQSNSVVAKRAQYDATLANDFFDAQASAAGVNAPRLPDDGGVIALAASERLTLGGSLIGTSMNGRGAALDISSGRIRIGATGGAPAQPGELLLDASGLTRLSAESLLLGGTRRDTATGTAIDVLADTVTVDAGAELAGPELLVAARNEVTVKAGATVAATGETQDTAVPLLLTGNSGFLRVSSGALQKITRTGASGAQGRVTLEQNALIRSPGAVTVDVSAGASTLATLNVLGVVDLAAPSISLGDAPLGTSGLVLGRDLLAGLGASGVTLRSSGTLDVFGPVSLGVSGALSLSASGIVARTPGASLSLTADKLSLSGFGSLVATAGDGTFAARAAKIMVGDGAFGLSGFRDARFEAAQELRLGGTGTLGAAGDLAIVAPTIVGDAAADYQMTAGGLFSYASLAPPGTVEPGGLGGRLAVRGRAVDFDGAVVLGSGALSLAATGLAGTDGVRVGSRAAIDLRGAVRSFDGVQVATPAGTFEASSLSGNIAIENGSVIDVSAAGEAGDAGAIRLLASQGALSVSGSLRALGSASGRGGDVVATGRSLGDFAALNRLLNAGGFSHSRAIRLTGPGDLFVGGLAEDAIRANDVRLTADQGRVYVAGLIDASGPSGGTVTLSSGTETVVAGSVLANGTEGEGGSVALQAGGAVRILEGGLVDLEGAAGANGGTLRIRQPRDAVLSALGDPAQSRLTVAGRILGARGLEVEGVATYLDANGLLTADELAADLANPRFADADAFATGAAGLATALDLPVDLPLKLLAGIDIYTPGNLTLSSEWDLFPWRFGGSPGVLTLRAGGNLTVNASINDAFASSATAELLASVDDTWSYRFVAGSDLAAADPLAVQSLVSSPPALRFGASSQQMVVRTGSGRIDLASAGDITFGSAANVYTAGRAAQGVYLAADVGGLGSSVYPDDGGDITAFAGRDIVGVSSNQFVTEWLWRAGRSISGTDPLATGWTVDFASFRQTLGALGGGDVRVEARRDITNLEVSIPSIGKQIGGSLPQESQLDIVAGGDLDVTAGNDLAGGKLYVGLGTGRVAAGGRLRENTAGFAPALAVGDARFDLAARRGLVLETAADPMLFSQGASQFSAGAGEGTYFTTYAPTSAVDLLATAGDLRLKVNSGNRFAQSLLGSLSFVPGDEAALRILPPTLRAAATEGNVVVGNSFTLFPAPKGNLELLAQHDVSFQTAGGFEVVLSDADLKLLPTPADPDTASTATRSALVGVAARRPEQFSTVPVHSLASQPDGIADDSPTRIVAALGDVRFVTPSSGDGSRVFSAKPVRVVAGRDVAGVSVEAQNLTDDDVSSVIAGRDFRDFLTREPTGGISADTRGVTIGGPGRLEISVGRNIDFQASVGVTTTGNVRNPALPSTGASVSITAGLNGHLPDYDAFIETYFQNGGVYDKDLIAYVARRLNVQESALTKSAALAALRGMSRSAQAQLIETAFFSELRTSGRAAANAGGANGDFSRAFTAITTLFPGANPDVDAGEVNAYSGNLSLYFSQAYTLRGGDISLFAPGGAINAGLATPPSAFGINKVPSQLGIVAQSSGDVNAFLYDDFLVNESRVFAGDGGNILVWSTRGDIDAGRGAKTAISAPPPQISFDSNGNLVVSFPAALAGSGIRTLATSPGRKPGNVDLFAPHGVVNAGDAGIVAGNLTIAATAVLGADNIDVSGVSVGVPVDTGGFAAALTGVSAVASSASNAAQDTVTGTRQAEQGATPLADQALSFLDVFVTGFGDCDPTKENCEQRGRQGQRQ